MSSNDTMEKLVSLAKRRGYVFQSSEIYGGTGSVWDYGPLGIELKRNVKELWWSRMVHQRDDVEGLDAAILMHPRVWEASGHVEGFTDPLVECRVCKKRFRQDTLPDQACGRKPSVSPGEDAACELGEPRLFNLMFRTFMGPVEDGAHTVYLRPETAQGSYVNFLNVQTASRQKIPFGIAQIGKAFRNEITPGNFIFRTREFEQAEMQFFVEPGTDDEWFDRWLDERMAWHLSLGIREDHLRIHEHGPDELAHYDGSSGRPIYLSVSVVRAGGIPQLRTPHNGRPGSRKQPTCGKLHACTHEWPFVGPLVGRGCLPACLPACA